MKAFWDIAPCTLVGIHRSFRGVHCLHHRSSPWWWRQYALLKLRCTPTRLHGAIFQKAFIFILTAMRAWSREVHYICVQNLVIIVLIPFKPWSVYPGRIPDCTNLTTHVNHTQTVHKSRTVVSLNASGLSRFETKGNKRQNYWKTCTEINYTVRPSSNAKPMTGGREQKQWDNK
jgi:hypothetical protein